MCFPYTKNLGTIQFSRSQTMQFIGFQRRSSNTLVVAKKKCQNDKTGETHPTWFSLQNCIDHVAFMAFLPDQICCFHLMKDYESWNRRLQHTTERTDILQGKFDVDTQEDRTHAFLQIGTAVLACLQAVGLATRIGLNVQDNDKLCLQRCPVPIWVAEGGATWQCSKQKDVLNPPLFKHCKWFTNDSRCQMSTCKTWIVTWRRSNTIQPACWNASDSSCHS